MSARAAVRIDVARLHGGRADDRDRMAAALGQVSPAAIGLPPRATLIVRRLVAPRPLGRAGGLDAFARQVEGALRERAAHARRARSGGDCDDLVFEDDSELEAAIVTAWLRPTSAPARALLAALPGASEPLARWRRHVFSTPPLLIRTLSRLAANELAAAWLARFSEDELRLTARDLLRAHGADPSTDDAPPNPTARPAIADDGRAIAALDLLVPPGELRAAADRPAVCLLLRVALSAAWRPYLLATRGFMRALRALDAPDPGDVPPTAAGSAHVNVRDPAAVGTGGHARPGGADRPSASPTVRGRSPVSAAGPTGLARAIAEEVGPSAPPTATATATDGAVKSRFAGLLFLLNMFVDLELYGNLTNPAGSARGLSPFELLLLLGRFWFAVDLVADPVPPLLSRLTGLDEGERPGRSFEAPIWAVPDRWLRPWNDDRRIRRRGSVWHPAGFPVADEVRDRSCGARRRWLFAFTRYAEARLARALGEVDRSAAVALACRRPGTIVDDGDTLQARFALDSHPIALRLAGLDRDPGWLPAAGRRVLFEFG